MVFVVDADNGRPLELKGQADGHWRRGHYFAGITWAAHVSRAD
jgi:hypothetical protein